MTLIYIFYWLIFLKFYHKPCEKACDSLPSSATNQRWCHKVVLLLLVPPAAFATGQSMKINRAKVPLCSLSLLWCKHHKPLNLLQSLVVAGSSSRTFSLKSVWQVIYSPFRYSHPESILCLFVIFIIWCSFFSFQDVSPTF